MKLLKVQVGQTIEASLDQFDGTLQAAMAGKSVKPHFAVGFRSMSQFGEVFTAKRRELVEALKASGATSIYALARQPA